MNADRRRSFNCPFRCQKYETALAAAQKLAGERKELSGFRNKYNALCLLSGQGFLLLGVEQKGEVDIAVVLRYSGGKSRDVFAFLLYPQGAPLQICKMELQYRSRACAEIVDWNCNVEDCGYGSMLMRYLLVFLSNAGFRRVIGSICPTDFNHEDKLRHFYHKFGFKITDFPDHRELLLCL